MIRSFAHSNPFATRLDHLPLSALPHLTRPPKVLVTIILALYPHPPVSHTQATHTIGPTSGIHSPATPSYYLPALQPSQIAGRVRFRYSTSLSCILIPLPTLLRQQHPSFSPPYHSSSSHSTNKSIDSLSAVSIPRPGFITERASLSRCIHRQLLRASSPFCIQHIAAIFISPDHSLAFQVAHC